MSDSQSDWKVKTPKKRKPTQHQPIAMTTITSDIITNDIGEVNEITLPNKYVLWNHDLINKKWTIESYNKMCVIATVSDFWKVFNNFKQLGYKSNNFFLMREDTEPTWEHVNNRNGGTCSFRTSMDDAVAVYEDLCSRMMCSVLNNNMTDITGISFCPRNNWAIIKIWNKDSKNDLTQTLDAELIRKYKDLSIKYKSNEPEY